MISKLFLEWNEIKNVFCIFFKFGLSNSVVIFIVYFLWKLDLLLRDFMRYMFILKKDKYYLYISIIEEIVFEIF